MAAAANGRPERRLNAGRRLLARAAAAAWRQLANAITLARLVCVLPIWMLIDDARYEAALLLFAVAAVSDAVDGAVAKLTGTASAFGAVLDPLVDKLMLGCLFIVAGTLGWTSLWLVALVVGRDMALAVGVVRLQLLAHSRPLEPLLIGKLCTMTQFFFFGVLLAEAGGLVPHGILHYLAAAAVVLTALASLAAYLWFARAGSHTSAARV